MMPHPLFAHFDHQMELLALIANAATCISCKLGPQVAQLALVQDLVISWHHLHCFQSWPPSRITCIATLPWIVLLISVSIELVSSSARVTSVKSRKRDGHRPRPIDRTPNLPGSDRNELFYGRAFFMFFSTIELLFRNRAKMADWAQAGNHPASGPGQEQDS